MRRRLGKFWTQGHQKKDIQVMLDHISHLVKGINMAME